MNCTRKISKISPIYHPKLFKEIWNSFFSVKQVKYVPQLSCICLRGGVVTSLHSQHVSSSRVPFWRVPTNTITTDISEISDEKKPFLLRVKKSGLETTQNLDKRCTYYVIFFEKIALILLDTECMHQYLFHGITYRLTRTTLLFILSSDHLS
jgi:hypothetical protein